MPELRYNPLLDTWTMVATNRQNRPHLPANWCAFCPGETKLVPTKYDVFAYPNDFPTLSQSPEAFDKKGKLIRPSLQQKPTVNVKSYSTRRSTRRRYMNSAMRMY